MLNASLTVQCKSPGSHFHLWNEVTDKIITHISSNKKNIIFILWVVHAYKKISLIDQTKHKVVVTSHPSGRSCAKSFRNYPAFNNFDHFGEINTYLVQYSKSKITWG
jgi:uracil-DNA glycosylase